MVNQRKIPSVWDGLEQKSKLMRANLKSMSHNKDLQKMMAVLIASLDHEKSSRFWKTI